MKFLHTADWHLGRYLHGHSLLADQAHVLEQLVWLARDEAVDAVVIAGDVYDRSSPPAEAVELLDHVLSELVLGVGVATILIAGNHDSPQRIGFGTSIFRQQKLHVRGSLERLEPIVLADAHGQVAFHALPYVDPIFARTSQCLNGVTNHQEATSHLVDGLRARREPGQRNVLIGHAFVAGGSGCDSERPLSVGGSGMVSCATFDGFDYVALGHLHRPQSAGSSRVRYSGSLLKYSVNEADHVKSVSVVDLDAAGEPRVREVSLQPVRDVRIIRGQLADLVSNPDRSRSLDDYICAELADTGPVLEPMARLREVYPNMLEIRLNLPSPGSGPSVAAGDHRKREPQDIFRSFYREILGEEASHEALGAFSEAADLALSAQRDAP